MRDSIENHVTRREYKPKVSGNSRYRELKVLRYPNGEECLETPSKMGVKKTQRDTIYMIEAKYENRLDLVAHRFYRVPTVYWAIACINELLDPFDIQAGEVVRVPAMSSLWGSEGVIK